LNKTQAPYYTESPSAVNPAKLRALGKREPLNLNWQQVAYPYMNSLTWRVSDTSFLRD